MVTLSKKFGLNPSIDTCAVCGEDTEIILFGSSYKDSNGKSAEAPMKICTGKSLCERCQKVIDNGDVFVIEVNQSDADAKIKNPFRTGRLLALRKESLPKVYTTNPIPISYMGHDDFERIFGFAFKKDDENEQD